MKKTFFFLLLLASTAHAQSVAPAAGGNYAIAPTECVSSTQKLRIDSMLTANVRQLRAQRVLPAASQRLAATVSFSWPLRQKSSFNYNSIYSLIYFVDDDPRYPDHVLDWNCGTRAKDFVGGNHEGTDIVLWPFGWNMMAANQGEVVAAAPGVIIGKIDGKFDMNCVSTPTNDWNAVYLQHSDGTVTWYGHLKKGTLTSKPVGASVDVGEFLGNVGSSGSSGVPHLHFEVHDAQGKVVDPYHGPCNTSASLWAAQKPYNESTLNVLLTHSAPPIFNDCPQQATTNVSSSFVPGSQPYFAAYYHDQQKGQQTTYTIYRPDNSVFQTWTHTSPDSYLTSYWLWTYQLPGNAPSGTWRFTASYQGSTVTQTFSVGVLATAASRSAMLKLYPNPAHGRVVAELPAAPLAAAEATVTNQLGQVVSRQAFATRQVELPLPAAAGLYFVTLPTPDGPATQKLVVE